MSKLLVVLSIVLAAAGAEEAEKRQPWGTSYLRVKTSSGYVQGILDESCRTGKPFAAFKGIPYAEPPLGELRFRDPVPKANWNGIWNGTYQRPSCIESDPIASDPDDTIEPSEDCLYLNVYTPNLKHLRNRPTRPRAVMVFIHPGAFNSGSAREYFVSPDFLIDQDVVVVTFQYRLGSLGFLSFQNEEVPGNAGLKDQNLALKWVKANIKKFGGDPSRITIFGESAGSASVHYHTLSKASEGLFDKAIMESGTALTSWAYSPPEFSLRKAFALARNVGCRQKKIPEILNCLRRQPAELLVEKQKKSLSLLDLFKLRIIAFHPTSEPNLPGAFLVDHPLDLVLSGNFTKVPTIIGLNTDEGLLVYPGVRSIDPKGRLMGLMSRDLSRFVPYNFSLNPFTQGARRVHERISNFYVNAKIPTPGLQRSLWELITDTMFTHPIQLTADLISRFSPEPLYNYLFNYDGGYNMYKVFANMTHIPGVCHGDELGYLFYTKSVHTECGKTNVKSSDEIIIDRMTKLWANFAKTGRPTPKLEREIGCMWQPYSPADKNYLEIGVDVKPSKNVKDENMNFWNSLIEDLSRMSAEER